MSSTTTRTRLHLDPRILLAVSGPLLLGALPGLRFGMGPALRLGPGFLAAVLATAAVMGPALYLLWGLTGARGTLKDVRGGFVDGLAAAGRVHLGFAPVVLLLSATVAYRNHALIFGVAAFAAGLLVGVVRLWRALRPGASGAHTALVLLPWLAACVLMGGRLVNQLVDAAVAGRVG